MADHGHPPGNVRIGVMPYENPSYEITENRFSPKRPISYCEAKDYGYKESGAYPYFYN